MTADTALKTLGLDVPVTRADLKAAFRTIAKTSHPDATQRKDSTAFIAAWK
jgi:DnaJ-class molecular chaperone